MSLDVYNRSGEVVRQQDIPAAFSNTDIDPGVVHHANLLLGVLDADSEGHDAVLGPCRAGRVF